MSFGSGNIKLANNVSRAMQVNLPDGTRLWLSEGSTLTYNEKRFASKRDVRLVGEADFDVAKDSRPFRVLAPSIEVRVHGTAFNVRDFPGEDHAEATLAEGVIDLKTSTGTNHFYLAAGQRATFKEHSRDLTVEEVNVDRILYRRDGIISIGNATIHEIAERIMKDFDVDLVAVKAGPAEKRYTFNYTEHADIEDVLDMIEAISSWRFEIRKPSN